MSAKKIFVSRPSLPPLEEYMDEIRDIWETGIMTHQGPKHMELQEKLQSLLDAPNITLFGNGHLALELGIKSMHLSGEAITTPFTFGSTTQAILRNDMRPVYCDIRPDDYTMDADAIEDLITERTSAIVPVNVYGNICEIDKIEQIAKKHGLKVIYDSAHAFGETYQGRNASTFGDASMFSFHATKVFNTVEGGCLTYHDASLTQYLEGLRQFGQIVKTDVTPYIGTNAKMTDIHAAMGLCNLRHFKESIANRKKVVDIYRRRLTGAEGLKLSVIQEDVESNYAYFPLVIEEEETGIDREQVIKALADENIFVRKYFYPLCSDFEIIRELGIKSDVPVASYISDRVITLPCYSDLLPEEAEKVCDIILNLYR